MGKRNGACASGRGRCAAGMFVIGLLTCWATNAEAQIQWRTGISQLSGKTPAEVVATLAADAQRSGERHFGVRRGSGLLFWAMLISLWAPGWA
jgi:hypothetical protein